MRLDRTIRTDRQASLHLEGQWHGAGRIANTCKPFRRDTRWPKPSRLQQLADKLSPDFYVFLGTAIVTGALGLLAIWVAL